LRSPARFQKGVEKLVSLAKSNLPKLKDDPIILEQLAASWMDSQAYMLNAYRSVSRYLSGASIGAESSANKVFWSEMDLEIHTLAMRILGAEAEILPESNFWMNSSVDPDQWLDGFLFSQAGPIYAGSNEIQRNIIAERLLGMPR
jgi:alkylation response protein AidB-like acyl-CoA dehydrogenase